jgi:hypothetical protein
MGADWLVLLHFYFLFDYTFSTRFTCLPFIFPVSFCSFAFPFVRATRALLSCEGGTCSRVTPWLTKQIRLDTD